MLQWHPRRHSVLAALVVLASIIAAFAAEFGDFGITQFNW
jgi:hypothetical protein